MKTKATFVDDQTRPNGGMDLTVTYYLAGMSNQQCQYVERAATQLDGLSGPLQ
jgi:hypothetical protein